MKRLLVVAGVIGVVVLAALFVAPAVIDWNSYRGSIAAELSRATGRRVILDGPIEASFLPAPRILANNVRLSGPKSKDAENGDLLRLRAVELQVGLLPLLTGHVVVEKLTLVRPEILVETDDSGQARWVMDGAGGDLLPEVALRHFAISDGTLVWRDRDHGVRARIEKIAMKLTADSLSGPAKAEGSAQVGNIPVRFTANIGPAQKASAIPINFTLAASSLDAKGEFSGQWLPSVEKLTGHAKASGSDTRTLVAALFGTDAAAGVGAALIAHPFALEGNVSAKNGSIEAKDISLDLADQHATGTVSVHREDGSRPMAIEANFSASRVDLDRLATVPPLPIHAASSEPLPSDLKLALDFSTDAVLVSGKVVQGFVVKASLDDGILAFQRLEGQLPGAGSFAVTGSLGGHDHLAFDGSLDIKTANLRDILSWLQVNTDSVPAGRLANAVLKAKISADADRAELSDIDLHVDSTRAHGSARFDFKNRAGVHLDLAADNLDLDAYRDSGETSTLVPAAATTIASALIAPTAAPGLFADLSGDGRFSIGRLSYRGMDVRGVDFTASLTNGEFTVVNFSGVPPDPGEFQQPIAATVESAQVPPAAAPLPATSVAGNPSSTADDRNDFVRQLLESIGASSSNR